jgi:hypothetical protein
VGDEPIDAGQRIDPLELEPVTGDLPAGFETLWAEVLAEGFRQVEQLAAGARRASTVKAKRCSPRA